jgi:hypothetical protein
MQSLLRRQLDERGYVVVPAIVPQENLEAVIADIWQHLGADARKPATWYKPGIVQATGMVEMYHYQSMWDNRQHQSVHQIFTDLFGDEKLWVSLDRVNFKPPVDAQHPEYDNKGFIHWDVDIARYPNLPFGVQGVLALSDTDEDMGGFQCIPEIYQELAAWLEQRPADQRRSRTPDLSGHTITKVPLRAGDIVIWRDVLPHGNGQNRSSRPRLAQYISMFPAREQDIQERQMRLNCWQKNAPPPHPFFPGDPRRIEERLEQPARLTSLGRKLLGLNRWI